MQLNSTPPSNIPVVSINGRLEKASYFQVMQTARWKAHTKNRCLDLKVVQMLPVTSNAPNILFPRTVDITKDQENLGALSQEAYSYAFQQQGEQFKTSYIAASALMESVKLVQSIATGQLIGGIIGGVFGIIGMVQAVESGDEIKASFEKGSKWVKNEADDNWTFVIGATKDTTVTASRIAWPNPAIKELPDPLPNGDYPTVTFQITYPIRLPNDGIVGANTQESPQERNWRSGSTTSGLNLEANKVDHFSQANHPTVRRQIEATITGISSNLSRVRDAFLVR